MCVNVVTALNVWVVCISFLLLFVWLQLKLKGRWGSILARDAQKPLVSRKVLSFVHTSSICLFFFTS